MPQPSLGAAAKTEIASTRVTKTEAAVLEARYGSKSKALRKLVDAEMERELQK